MFLLLTLYSNRHNLVFYKYLQGFFKIFFIVFKSYIILPTPSRISRYLLRFTIPLIILPQIALATTPEKQIALIDRQTKKTIPLVIPDLALPSEKRAATELEKYLEQITGRDFQIIPEKQSSPTQSSLYIGQTSLARTLSIIPPRTNSPWEDAFRIKVQDQNIFIIGANPRGTLFGAYELLEKLDVRWFTAEIVRVPRRNNPVIPVMDESHRPAFIYRSVYIQEAFNPLWASHLRLNGHGASPEDSFGGIISFGRFAHTLGEIVPESLAQNHPEYFPEIGGFRVVTDADKIQRELTNPDVLTLTNQKLASWIKETPDTDIFSISQNDGHGWSESAAMRKLLDKYGTNSGVMLWFVNQAAAQMAREHPDKFIETLAYLLSEAPPRNIFPRDNVIIRLCAYWCMEGLPYEESSDPMTRDFVRNLRGWSKLTPNLWIWHYGTGFAHYLMPFPDFEQFPRNFRLYQNQGVKGVFFQGSYQSPGGNWAELRAYVVGRLLWNPQADPDVLIDEWMRGVYGRGWRSMRDWFDLIHTETVRTGGLFGIYAPTTQPFLNEKILNRSQALLRRARYYSRSDRTARAQIEKAALWLDYARLSQSRKNAPAKEQFARKLKTHGITQISEWETVDEWVKR